MIFAVQKESKDVALFLFEDHRRPGELIKDFPYLCPQYYKTEDEWDDHRNLITVLVLPFAKTIDPEMKDDLLYLADSMIEYKPAVDTKVEFVYDPIAIQYYREWDKEAIRFIQFCFHLPISTILGTGMSVLFSM